MRETDNKGDYAIGYGKPPVETRFKQGASGNPKGRPRGSKNLQTLIDEEFEQRVVVQENGKRRRITKRQAAVKQLVNKFVSGDHRYAPLLYRLMEKQPGNGGNDNAMSFAGDGVITLEDALKLQETWKAIRAQQVSTNKEGGENQ